MNPYLDDILASFNERFKMNSNIFVSLSSLLPSKIGNLSYSDIQPAYDFYEEDLIITTFTWIIKKLIWILWAKIGLMKITHNQKMH